MARGIQEGMLRLTIVTAREFAEEGRLADGYRCLAQGLEQAQRAADNGEPWAASLVRGYLQAEADYITRYGVRLE
jgi:hypothetical protein